MGPPMPGAKEALRSLHLDGHHIIIFTTIEIGLVREWLRFHGVTNWDSITNSKPEADFYLDDKAVRFTNWPDFIEIVTREYGAD